MTDKYVPPAWRDRDPSKTGGIPRVTSSRSNEREPRPFPQRGRGRGPAAPAGEPKWRPPQDRLAGGHSDSILASSSREEAGSRAFTGPSADIWSSIPSASSSRMMPDKPTPRTLQPASRESHPTARNISVSDSLHRPRAQVQPSPTTPRRPQPSASLASPSSDLMPISSTHRAFKQLDEMEMLGTLSRSGGSEDGVGDGLLDDATQEKFYGWIEGKVSRVVGFVIGGPLPPS